MLTRASLLEKELEDRLAEDRRKNLCLPTNRVEVVFAEEEGIVTSAEQVLQCQSQKESVCSRTLETECLYLDS